MSTDKAAEHEAWTALERWEDEAAAFYKATGYLRPGKDYGAVSGHDAQREVERLAAWKAWSGGYCYADARATVNAALKPEQPPAGAQGGQEAASELPRRLYSSDPFCPKCGHNRDTSSVSSIDNGDGSKSCQFCGAQWEEVEASSQSEGAA
jgi:hypothetical protein